MKFVIFIFTILSTNIAFAQSIQDSSIVAFLYDLQNKGDDLVLASISYHSEIKCETCLMSIFSSKENSTLFLKTKEITKLSNFQRTQIVSNLKKIKNKNLVLIQNNCITPYQERQALYILYKGILYSFIYIPCQGLNFAKMLRKNKELASYLRILLVL